MRCILLLATLPLGSAQVFHHQTEQEEVFWISLTLLVFAILVLTFPVMSWGGWGSWRWTPANAYSPYYVDEVPQGFVVQGSPVPGPATKMDPPTYREVNPGMASAAASSSAPRFAYFSSSQDSTGAARDRARLSEVSAVFHAEGPGFKM